MIEVLNVREMREKLSEYCDTVENCVFCKCKPNEDGICYSEGASDDEVKENFKRVFGEQSEPSEPITFEAATQKHTEFIESVLIKYEAKSDRGKLRLSMVPRGIVEAVAAIREYGTAKYGDPESWKNVSDERYWDAALRHMEAARNDMHSKDDESGFEHLWHVACNLAFIIAREER